MTLARRLATPPGGLIVIALAATIVFFAILTAVEQTCSECGVPSEDPAAAPDLIAGAPAPAPAAAAEAGAPAQPAPADPPKDPPAAADHAAGPKDPPAAADHAAGPTDPPAAKQDEPAAAAAPEPAPAADVTAAAEYVRAFYADLAKRNFKAAWPRLAGDLRAQHGGFDAWRSGFATTVSQSTSPITAKAVGPAGALVTLTLTAVDRNQCGHKVERHFAVSWRLELRRNAWTAAHAAARPLDKAPAARFASC